MCYEASKISKKLRIFVVCARKFDKKTVRILAPFVHLLSSRYVASSTSGKTSCSGEVHSIALFPLDVLCLPSFLLHDNKITAELDRISAKQALK